MPDYRPQLETIRSAITAAGEIARRFQTEGFEQLADKTKGDPFLTEADLAIDSYLQQTLLAAYPDYGWFSEETPPQDNPLAKEFCWVVDPIDGTREFVAMNGEFVISIGLVHHGKAVLGGIYAPMKNQLILGGVGCPVTLNGDHIPPAQPKPLAEIVCGISRSETAAGLWAPYQGVIPLQEIGSVAYKLGLVAIGEIDMTISLRPKNLWDVCAGHALIEASGGVFEDLDGSTVSYPLGQISAPQPAPPSYLLSGLFAARQPDLIAAVRQALHINPGVAASA